MTNRMISDRAVTNFRSYMMKNPIGAHDSALPRPYRNGIPLREFERGGAFDEAGSTAIDAARSALREALIASVDRDAQPQILSQLDALLKMAGVEIEGDDETDLPESALAGDSRPKRVTEEQAAAFFGRYPEAKNIRNLGR